MHLTMRAMNKLHRTAVASTTTRLSSIAMRRFSRKVDSGPPPCDNKCIFWVRLEGKALSHASTAAELNYIRNCLAADGVFRPDGTFVPLPPVPEELLVEEFRREVRDFLVNEGAISPRAKKPHPRLAPWRR